MTAEEAIAKYTEKFGGYPAFLLMGADDNEIVETLMECVRTGKELEPEEDGDY